MLKVGLWNANKRCALFRRASLHIHPLLKLDQRLLAVKHDFLTRSRRATCTPPSSCFHVVQRLSSTATRALRTPCRVRNQPPAVIAEPMSTWKERLVRVNFCCSKIVFNNSVPRLLITATGSRVRYHAWDITHHRQHASHQQYESDRVYFCSRRAVRRSRFLPTLSEQLVNRQRFEQQQ